MEERLYDVMRASEERHWWFRGRRAVIAALIDRLGPKPGARVLDAGCGTGRNLELYASRIGPVTGVDPSPAAIEYCRERGQADVHVGDAQRLPLDDGGFDLVAATDVIEHVPDDLQALREMRRVAAPGAGLLITVPANPWMWSSEDVRLEHHRRYTAAMLSDRARKAGWEPRFLTHFNTILMAPIAIARKLPAPRSRPSEVELTPGVLDGPLSLPMRAEAALIRRGVRLPVGVSLGLVCRRA